MKIDGAIFDLDGTLLDSMPMWDGLGAQFLLSCGITPKSDLIDKIRLLTLSQAAELFRAEYGLDLSVVTIERKVHAMIEALYATTVQAKAGAAELLRSFKQRGVKMCIATATDTHLAKAALARLGLLDCFEVIITCGDTGFGKDSPEIFELALEKIGTQKAHTVVFEDAIHAVKTAKSAGFPVVAVYDESFAASEQEIRDIADLYLRSLLEMEDYLD